jgi:hypothetical protein
LLGAALFQPGGVIGEFDLDVAALDAALADLDDAQVRLGDNPEATFWRGVLPAAGLAPPEAVDGLR